MAWSIGSKRAVFSVRESICRPSVLSGTRPAPLAGLALCLGGRFERAVLRPLKRLPRGAGPFEGHYRWPIHDYDTPPKGRQNLDFLQTERKHVATDTRLQG